MNTVYRVVWNAVAGCWVVASEVSKSRRKNGAIARAALAVALAAATGGAMADALDGGTILPTNTNPGTIAYGPGAQASDTDGGAASTAVGADAKATGNSSTAVGSTAQATGNGASAFGVGATAAGVAASAFGLNAHAADYGTAIGIGSNAGNYATAIGVRSQATGMFGTAIGPDSKATGLNSTAVGIYSNAAGGWSTALGYGATATDTSTIAIGYWAVASQARATAIGYGAHAYGVRSLALGENAVVTSDSYGATALGLDSYANGTDASAFGSAANADGYNAFAIGTSANAHGSNSLAIGTGANAAANSVALGNGAVADVANTVSVGNTTTQRRIVNLAAGTGDTDGVNVSQLRGVAAAIGGGSTVNTDGSISAPTIAVDGQTFDNVTDAVESIDGRVSNVESDVADLRDDALLWDSASGAFSASHGGVATNKITHVAAGDVTQTSTDAINGSQLQGVSQSVADALGGGSTVNNDGSVSAPTYVVNGGSDTYHNVGDAITNIDGRTTQNTTDIANITTQISNGTVGLVQQAAPGARLTVGKDVDGAEVNFTGTAGDRKLTGVAAGSADTDAVNVSQLKSVQQSVASTGERSVKYKWNDANGNGVVDPGEVDFSVAELEGPVSTDGGVTGGTVIANVHRGAVNALSTEAINGSQLYGTALSIATNLGGGAAVNADGTVSAPAYTLANGNGGTSTYDNVGDALGNLDSRTASNTTQISSLDGRVTSIEGDVSHMKTDISNLDGRVINVDGRVTTVEGNVTHLDNRVTRVEGDVSNLSNQINNGQVGLVKQETSTSTVTVAKGTGGKEVSVAGTDGERRISGVAPGVADYDAANMQQVRQSAVQAVSDANAYTDRRLDDWGYALGNRIEQVNVQANRGIAAASALMNVTPYLPGKTALNAGVASYRGETALGVGVSRWTNDGRLNVNGGVSMAAHDEPVYRMGIGVVF